MKFISRNSISFLAIILISTLTSSAQDYNVFFDFNSDILRINDVGKLSNILDKFNPNEHTIKLVGYTDTIGSNEYNLKLSRRRTNTVKEYLTKKGIASDQISTGFKGKLNPVKSDQIYNRRVEIFLLSKQSKISSIEEFRKSCKPKPQKFTIPSDVDVEIEGNRGTIITISANSFLTKSGKKITGEVEIRLTEFYSMTDFFSEKLSTISEGVLLTSAGMIHIKVVQDDEELILRENTDIELAFPKSNETNYSTFYGERQENGNMNWQLDKQQLPSRNQQNIDNLGVTFGNDGNSLIVTDKATAEERNSKLNYNPISRKFKALSEEEKEDVEKYYQEQENMEMKRGDYYHVIKSKKLNYINCDEYLGDPLASPVEYTITLSDKKLKFVTAALIFRDTKSFLEFTTLENLTAKLSAKIPLNGNVELLVTGTTNGQPYFYHSEVNLTEHKNDIIELIPTSYEEIKESL